MKRVLVSLPVLGGVLLAILPGAAQAATSTTVRTVSGQVVNISGSDLTIQTPGQTTGVLDALTATANAVTAEDLPYVWGGGHAEAGVPSAGMKGGPGANGRTVGYDCSGAVAAVLAGGGLWPIHGGVPSDSGVISELLAEGIIARGAGSGPEEVTLYDDPGVHIFMNIDGRFFGTSDGYGGNPDQKKGGAGWLDDGAPDAHSRVYKQYHVLASVLHDRGTYSHTITFQTVSDPGLLAGVAKGDNVRVSFVDTTVGTMTAQALSSTAATTTPTAPSSGTSSSAKRTVSATKASTTKASTTKTSSTKSSPTGGSGLNGGSLSSGGGSASSSGGVSG